MATKRQKKKAVNTAKKVAKKNPTIPIVFLVILLLIGGAFAALYFTGTFDKWLHPEKAAPTQTTEPSGSIGTGENGGANGNVTPSQGSASSVDTSAHSHAEDGIAENIIYDNFQIHFMELGNEYAGDSTYIKAGDVDILIDAGSRGSSSRVINEYIKQYCTDGKLEYVIATHNHQDHIAGFAGVSDTKAKNFKGEKVSKTGVLYYYEVGTLIDFTYAGVTENNKTVTYDNKTQVSSSFGSGTEYGKYLAAREYLISNGTKYYTAKDLWDNNTTSFTLADGITMDILYNYYYFNQSSDINNYSVCTLFNYNEHHFLLTGDLELDGEKKLSDYYDGTSKEKTLPHCDLFKAGHHGSKTSSNECLLEKISPNICCVCCCAGTSEYSANLEHQFPTQAFINRIAKYTSRVYVTSMIEYVEEKWKVSSMNGNIVVTSNGTSVGVKASNNLIRLKDTDWFNEKIYAVKTNDKYAWNEAGDKFDVHKNCTKTEDKVDKMVFFDKDTPNAILMPRRTWPANGVQ